MKNSGPALLDRDLSILSFNERVLSLAQREDYPLLERLRFLCIVASNLDEFFEVRMAAQLEALQNDHEFLTRGGVFSQDWIESYIEFKMADVTELQMTPHPLEFDMYYSC